VAHYNEPLGWLRRVPPAYKLSVYDKGEAGDGIRLPNIGREAHTYLTHITRNYHRLADITVFCQGRPFDHASDFHRILREVVAGEKGGGLFEWFGFLVDTDDEFGRRLFVPWSKNPERRTLDIRGAYRELFGEPGPAEYTFVGGAQFSARRELIWRRPLEFYERALELSGSFPDAAHCFERLWDQVFGVVGVDREWLAGRKTVYRKRDLKSGSVNTGCG